MDMPYLRRRPVSGVLSPSLNHYFTGRINHRVGRCKRDAMTGVFQNDLTALCREPRQACVERHFPVVVVVQFLVFFLVLYACGEHDDWNVAEGSTGARQFAAHPQWWFLTGCDDGLRLQPQRSHDGCRTVIENPVEADMAEDSVDQEHGWPKEFDVIVDVNRHVLVHWVNQHHAGYFGWIISPVHPGMERTH